MKDPAIDDNVRVLKDIPEISLNRDEIGIVRSTWFAPEIAYEVEFPTRAGRPKPLRALLTKQQIEVASGTS